jgi:rare lipoprotein A
MEQASDCTLVGESEAKMRNAVRIGLVLMAGAALAACGTSTPRYTAKPSAAAPDTSKRSYVNADGQKVGRPYQIGGVWYVPREQPNYDETGIASWYGPGFHMKATATGETFDMEAVSAAHTTLPLPSMVEVTNLDNGRKLVVRINDRGPFVNNRIIDLSKEAARQLGFERAGVARVRVKYLGAPSLLGRDAGVRYASNRPTPSSPRRSLRRLLPSQQWSSRGRPYAPPGPSRSRACRRRRWRRRP